jgi:uncharacterized membrane protein
MSTHPLTPIAAKEPRTPLAGPYGHPFHPILVTVPIGAWVAAVVFQVAAEVNDSKEAVFAEGAYWLIGLGILGALAAALFGLMDLLTIPRRTPAFTTALTHMGLNLAVVALFAIDFGIRAGRDRGDVKPVDWVLSLVAVALLGVSGWLGGKLAYHYGVRVADEQTQAEGFRNLNG